MNIMKLCEELGIALGAPLASWIRMVKLDTRELKSSVERDILEVIRDWPGAQDLSITQSKSCYL